MSPDELIALKEYMQQHLSKGFIRASSSPASAPVMLIKKGDGSLQFFVDYRGINQKTVKNSYLLPLIQDTSMKLFKAK